MTAGHNITKRKITILTRVEKRLIDSSVALFVLSLLGPHPLVGTMFILVTKDYGLEL